MDPCKVCGKTAKFALCFKLKDGTPTEVPVCGVHKNSALAKQRRMAKNYIKFDLTVLDEYGDEISTE